jgi:hypothetical protein
MGAVRRTLRSAAVVAVSACLTLTACSGDDNSAQDDPSDTPSSPSPSTTLPAGVELTEPGTDLAYGETGTAEYAPTQSLGSVLSFTVKNATRGRLSDLKGFNLDDPYRKNANYYYVNVTVANVGDGDLGGRDIPLNGVNEKDTLLPPVVFQSAFNKCPSKKLPKPFGQGASFDTCLVFLAPDKGQLVGVSFRPDDTVEPILWTGEVQPPPPLEKKKRQG